MNPTRRGNRKQRTEKQKTMESTNAASVYAKEDKTHITRLLPMAMAVQILAKVNMNHKLSFTKRSKAEKERGWPKLVKFTRSQRSVTSPYPFIKANPEVAEKMYANFCEKDYRSGLSFMNDIATDMIEIASCYGVSLFGKNRRIQEYAKEVFLKYGEEKRNRRRLQTDTLNFRYYRNVHISS